MHCFLVLCAGSTDAHLCTGRGRRECQGSVSESQLDGGGAACGLHRTLAGGGRVRQSAGVSSWRHVPTAQPAQQRHLPATQVQLYYKDDLDKFEATILMIIFGDLDATDSLFHMNEEVPILQYTISMKRKVKWTDLKLAENTLKVDYLNRFRFPKMVTF